MKGGKLILKEAEVATLTSCCIIRQLFWGYQLISGAAGLGS